MPQDFFETIIPPMGVAGIHNYRTGTSPIIAPNGSLVLVQACPKIGIYGPGLNNNGSYCKVMLSIGANTITASYLNDTGRIYVGGRPGAIEFSYAGNPLTFYPQIYGNQGGALTTPVEFDIYGSATVTAGMSVFRFTLDRSYRYYFASSYSSPAHLCHCVFYPTTGRLTVDTSTCPHLDPNDPDDRVIPTKYEVFAPFRLKSQNGVYRYLDCHDYNSTDNRPYGAYSGMRIYSSDYESASWPDPINDPHPDLGWVIDSFENETNQWGGTTVRSVTKDGVTYYRDFSQPSIAERFPPVFPA